MMDVGSGGGYYTNKSPKMLLHELCQKQKYGKPRYVNRKADDGKSTCKVSPLDILCHHDGQHAAIAVCKPLAQSGQH